MINIEWEGTFGYGDIVSAINHALLRQHIHQEEVTLTLNWFADRQYEVDKKYHPNDPETVGERAWFLIKRFDRNNDINVKFEKKPPWRGKPQYRPKFLNRMYEDKWYGTMNPHIKPRPQTFKNIVIWTPETNVEDPFDDYGTRYKAPLSVNDGWRTLRNTVETMYGDQYDIRYVNYRMSVSEAVYNIDTADICIGYEGIGNVLAKSMWKPMIVFSDQKAMTDITSGPWAQIENTLSNSIMNLEDIMSNQRQNIKLAENSFCSLIERLSK